MNINHRHFAASLLTIALLQCAGCQTTGVFVVSRLALQKPPLAIAVVVDPAPTTAIAPFNPFSSYLPLQLAMADALGRPVSVDSCFAFQAGQGLTSGWYAVAVVTASQYAAMSPDARARVLAVSADSGGRTLSSALLVVPQRSAIRSISDLRGRVVAFGPAGDSLTHHAALQLLRESGVAKTDLSLEVLPVPGSLKHFPNAKAVAQSVLNDSSAAGFVEEAVWEQMPESPPDSGTPARSQFRIIGRTIALPQTLFIGSPTLDARTADRIGKFLAELKDRKPDVAESLRVGGYVAPDADVFSACDTLRLEAGATKSPH